MFEINLKNMFNKKVAPLDLPRPQHAMVPDPDRPGEYIGIPFTPRPPSGPYSPTSIRPHLPDKNLPHKPPAFPIDRPKPDLKYTIPEYPVTRSNTPTGGDWMITSNPIDLNKPPTFTSPVFSPTKELGFFKPQVPSDISGPLKAQAMESINKFDKYNYPSPSGDVNPMRPRTDLINSSGSPGSPGASGAPNARKKKSAKPKPKRCKCKSK